MKTTLEAAMHAVRIQRSVGLNDARPQIKTQFHTLMLFREVCLIETAKIRQKCTCLGSSTRK